MLAWLWNCGGCWDCCVQGRGSGWQWSCVSPQDCHSAHHRHSGPVQTVRGEGGGDEGMKTISSSPPGPKVGSIPDCEGRGEGSRSKDSWHSAYSLGSSGKKGGGGGTQSEMGPMAEKVMTKSHFLKRSVAVHVPARLSQLRSMHSEVGRGIYMLQLVQHCSYLASRMC